ncbi:hypothetical protein BJ742DRAFT_654269, partial [Cladochytrium replicatum]
LAAPHYFGEMIEWTGYIHGARLPAALAFLMFRSSNLVPSTIKAHKWCHEK